MAEVDHPDGRRHVEVVEHRAAVNALNTPAPRRPSSDTHTRLTAFFRDYPGWPVPER